MLSDLRYAVFGIVYFRGGVLIPVCVQLVAVAVFGAGDLAQIAETKLRRGGRRIDKIQPQGGIVKSEFDVVVGAVDGGRSVSGEAAAAVP